MALTPERCEEQDRLEDLPVNHEEGQPEQKPCGPAREGVLHGFPDIALPFAGLRFAVHPYADRQQDESGEKRSEPLHQLAARTTHSDQVGRCHPCQGSGPKSGEPSAMDEGQNFRSLGLAQERDHRDHDQQCL